MYIAAISEPIRNLFLIKVKQMTMWKKLIKINCLDGGDLGKSIKVLITFINSLKNITMSNIWILNTVWRNATIFFFCCYSSYIF